MKGGRPDWLKRAVFAAALLPLAWLVWRGFAGTLGVNPIETVNRFLGDWALRFLLLSLAVTPVRRISGWNRLGRLRRMVGLFAFFYVCLHVTSYVAIDHFFDWRELWKDVLKRRYITVGMTALVLLIPLAATSTDAMVRRLGGRTWRRLHRLVYLIGPLAVLHYWWMVKAGHALPMLHAAILGVLLAYRLVPPPAAAPGEGRGVSGSAAAAGRSSRAASPAARGEPGTAPPGTLN